MSWDADLHDDRGHSEGEWNYTHNTSPMIYAVLDGLDEDEVPSARDPGLRRHPAWYDRLDGAPGPVGRDYLATLIRGLEADPDRFRAMNPPNKWGDYDSLLDVLREMRDRVPDWPTVWSASG